MKIKAIPLVMFLFLPFASFGSSTCPLPSGINVNTSKRVLNICEHGSVVKTFKVALGFKGVGKNAPGITKRRWAYMAWLIQENPINTTYLSLSFILLQSSGLPATQAGMWGFMDLLNQPVPWAGLVIYLSQRVDALRLAKITTSNM